MSSGQTYYIKILNTAGGFGDSGAMALQVNFGSGTMAKVAPPVTTLASEPDGNAVQNSNFASPNVGTGSSAYEYDPTGANWTFSGTAGVAGNGSGFTSGNPNAPSGTQVGFIQETGAISQTIDVPFSAVSISFAAAGAGNYGSLLHSKCC